MTKAFLVIVLGCRANADGGQNRSGAFPQTAPEGTVHFQNLARTAAERKFYGDSPEVGCQRHWIFVRELKIVKWAPTDHHQPTDEILPSKVEVSS